MEEKVIEIAREFLKLYDPDGKRAESFLSLSYRVLEERYKVVAHNAMTTSHQTLVGRLVALYAILEARGVDAFEAISGKGEENTPVTGAIRSISIGDSSTTFASSSGASLGNGGADGAIDQNNELARSFQRYWRELIANTRRLL